MIQKPKSGHPGTPMGMSPLMHTLFTKFLRFDPTDPTWIARDRFVLSNGHAGSVLYSMLHLCGFGITEEELKSFRVKGSRLAGHPEPGLIPGVEVATGPLGNGVASAVGLALVSKHLAALYNKPGFDLFNDHVFITCGDGCIQEGVTSEACSLAGALGLGNIVLLYDDNSITIDGKVDITFSENVLKRYEAYGWHVQEVLDGDNDLEGIAKAIQTALDPANASKPHIIQIHTTIGHGSLFQGTNKVHGAPLGDDDIAHMKKELGFDPEKKFFIDQDVRDYYNNTAIPRAKNTRKAWDEMFAKYTTSFPEEAASLTKILKSEEALDTEALLKHLEGLMKVDASAPAEATRKSSQLVMAEVANVVPQILGGSADLLGSTLACVKGSPIMKKDDFSGRNIAFGIREHAMCAIANGIASYGPNCAFIPYVSTFLVFAPYAYGAIRLAALSHLRILYIFTHDSIGVGEDGPTHQPIETITQLRAFPNMLVFRPADRKETIGAYVVALKNAHRPSVFALTRQNVPQLENTAAVSKDGKGGVDTGAYEIFRFEKEGATKECEKDNLFNGRRICLVGTGSEVSLAVAAAKLLSESGAFDVVRVVSAPCLELFDEQPAEYRAQVLGSCPSKPTNCDLVISVEAGATLPWGKYSHVQIGIDEFGLSAPGNQVYEHFHLTPEGVRERVMTEVKRWTGKCLNLLVN